jgi:LysM repeat protein
VFRQLDAPLRAHVRDAAPPKPRTITRDALERIVPIMADIGARIDRLEQKRAAQRQLAEQMALQQPSAQPQFEQPTHEHVQDHAAPCSCQQPKPTPHVYRDGVTTMVDRHPGLAPNRNIKFGCFPNPRMLEGKTRDQNSIENSYLERPSRFSSQEADRMANYLPPGSAGRTSNKEAVNDINLRVMRDAQHQYNISGQPQPAMTQGSDLSSAFASELQAIPSGQPNAAMNVLNKHYNAAKDGATRDAIERVWRDFQAHYDSRGDSPWRPRQPEVRDAPWSNLYEQNKGVIGGDPNKLSIGTQLSMPGGGTHTVEKGETLSGIASTPAGTDLGSKSLSAERGGMESTPAPSGSYSSGGTLSSSEGAPAGAPGAHNAANVPVPPTRPSGLGSSSGGGAGTDLGSKSLLAESGGGSPSGTTSSTNVGTRGQGEFQPPSPGTGGAYATPSHSQSMPNWAGGGEGSGSYGTGGASGIHPLSESGGSGLSQSGGSSDYVDAKGGKPRGKPRGHK